MTKRETAVLACRLFALYAFVQFLFRLEYLFQGGWTLLQPEFDASGVERGLFVMFVIPNFLVLLFGILVWRKADWLAERMLPGADVSVGESKLTAVELQTVAFTVVGLMAIVLSLPAISGMVMEYKMRMANPLAERLPSVWFWRRSAMFIVQFLLGVGLLFGSRGLTGLLRTIRKAGLRNDTD